MVANLIVEIQNNPDWIGIGLVAMTISIVLIIALYALRRKVELTKMTVEASKKSGEIAELNQNASGYRQEITELQKVNAGLIALDGQRVSQVKELEDLRETHNVSTAEIARLTEALVRQKTANDEKTALLNDTGDKLKSEFKALAAEVMRTHGEDFEKANRERLQLVLEPLKENIDGFKEELRGAQESVVKERAELHTVIKNLAEQSINVSEQAHNLTQALKGDSQKQGAWGEMVLGHILESSGLREGEEYVTQESYKDDDNRRKAPDVVVNFPDKRRLILDSKVSLTAYNDAVNADDPEYRAKKMKEHIVSVTRHIDSLSGKDYPSLDVSAANYVVMFMPIESAFAEAVRAGLVNYAIKKNIGLASPSTLTMLLRTVENQWSADRQNRYAVQIASEAGKMYDKFKLFLDDMGKLGNQMSTAQTTYGKAMNKLSEGKGNLLKRAENLKALGVDPSKNITLDYEDFSEDDPLLSPQPDPS